MSKRLLEIAAFSIEAALNALNAGADRIEFCENPMEGGTTPSYGSLLLLSQLIKQPVFPIIRPRGGDFLSLPFNRRISTGYRPWGVFTGEGLTRGRGSMVSGILFLSTSIHRHYPPDLG